MGSEVCAREIQQVADVCDEHLAGWSYWEFKKYQDLTTTAGTGSEVFYTNGHVQIAKVKALSRTFMRASQGTTCHSSPTRRQVISWRRSKSIRNLRQAASCTHWKKAKVALHGMQLVM